MIDSKQAEKAELNTALQNVKNKLSKYLTYLMRKGKQLACEAYNAYELYDKEV